MSLLMQALKKAEHTKQKQTEGAADEGLSLSPKEVVAEAVVRTETAPGKQDGLVASSSELALSPQLEEKTSEQHPAHEAASSSESLQAALPVIVEHRLEPSITNEVEKEKKEPVVQTDQPKKDSADLRDGVKAEQTRGVIQENVGEQRKAAAEGEKVKLAEQEKAKAVFSSKSPQAPQRTIWIALFAVLALAVPAGVAYYYWQGMNNGIDQIRANAQNNTLPPAPTIDENADSALKAEAPIVAADATAPAKAVVPALPAQQVAKSSMQASPAVSEMRNSQAEPMTPAKSADAVSNVRNPKAASGIDISNIQIRQSSRGNQINPALSSAYQFFIAGDATSARQQYQKVLQQEPNNRDALLGLAAIALNQRQAEQAGAFYGKLLELDPGDPDAIAGLTSLQQGDPAQSESRLKKALNQHPQAGALLFALGNLYAQQARWSDAQQTYFRAYASAPANGDYAFNLAVSLDKLNQGKLAKEYYQRALATGQSGPVNFSREAVQKRIRELEPVAN
jgi:Tfp pilus assembly protein PilF